MRVVATSGYFNPLHKGHIRLIKSAARLGDFLVVIVNNDKQVKLKGSYPFMDEKERLEIVQALDLVDYAILSKDTDGTQAKTLAKLKPNIFAKGGDRNKRNLPQSEIDVCKKYNIKIVYNVGGRQKIQSSSSLIDKLCQNLKSCGHR